MRRFPILRICLAVTGLLILTAPALLAGDQLETGRALEIRGHSQWLYQSVSREVIATNHGRMVRPRPSALRWTPLAPAPGAPNVLFYSDDYIHTAPYTPVDQALQNLGYPYTAHYDGDFSGFYTDLAAGGWDLVIFANDNYGPPGDILDRLYNYALTGGKLIVHGWTFGGTETHPLWSLMGVSLGGAYFDPPPGVYWLDPGNSVFNVPQVVPELLNPTSEIYGTYGFSCTPNYGFDGVAAYTSPPETPTRGDSDVALVLGENTIFKGFLDGQFSEDADHDGILDITELWIDMINGIIQGFSAYDLIYVDDAGRSKLCVNSSTGAYVYKVLQGRGMGDYPGQATLSLRNGVLFINSTTLSPRLQFYDNQRFHKAYGSFTGGVVRSYLDDKNTANNSSSCN